MKFIKKNLLNIILIAVLAAIIFIPGLRLKIRDSFFPIAEIENAVKISDADFDLDLKGINVPNTNLKTLRNNKLIFLNFWGTWCPPCREEWPTIQKLYESQNTKVDFVLVAMQDEEQDVREFLKKNNYTVPVYIAESPLSDKILPKIFPTTFLLDKTGRILLKEDGSKDWNSKSVHEFINAFVKESIK
ncbi:MAG: TlpA family protein disulfide reductase [Flavobacteriaceae bacterium]|jgi:thiol-disulfide isomerase/thioredoxin|nr:TlpA family protein disulfide reductase [Flavobacteriaceae bacterium]